MATTAKRKTPALTARTPAKTPARKPAGRSARDRSEARRGGRTTAIRVAAGLAAVVGGIAAALRFGLLDRLRGGNAEHPAPDLATDTPHNDGSARAPEAFRPDPTAPVTAAEREALRPATMPVGGTPDRHSEAVH